MLALVLLLPGDRVDVALDAPLSLGVAVPLLVSDPLPVGRPLTLLVMLPVELACTEVLAAGVALAALGVSLGVAGDADTDCVTPLAVALAVMERVDD